MLTVFFGQPHEGFRGYSQEKVALEVTFNAAVREF